MDRHIAIALTLLTLVVMGSTQSIMDETRIDNFMRKMQQCADLPALSIALVDLADKTSYNYTAAYGIIGPKLMERADTDTRFCLGGATEAFTAVLLAMLVHENENITWSTPLQNIVGHRLALSEMYRSRNLNLKDVLAQRTGYPNMDIVSVVSPYKPNRLSRNLRYVQPVAGFREEFVPNQVMYSLLEEVLYDLTQADWEDLIKNRILRPLKMNSIMFLGHTHDDQAQNVAQPVVFHKGKRQVLRMSSLNGLKLIRQAAGICLSAKDMTTWLRFLLDGKEKVDGETLVDMKVLEETFDGVQSRGHSDDPQISGYRQPDVEVSYAREQNGLGWITGHYRGHRFVSQDGSIPGIQTLATILPDQKKAVFTSFTGKGRGQGLAAKTLINEYLLDILLKERSWFDERNVCHVMEKMKMLHVEPKKEHENVKMISKYQGSRPTEDYVGYYRSYAYGTIHVKLNETEMFLEYGNARYKMFATNMNDTFQLIAAGNLLWFTTNSDSSVDSDVKIIAVFHEISRDPAHRISDVSISGFEKTGDVTFSRNPAPPRYETSPECHCGASVMTSAVSVLISFLFVFITVFFR